MRAGKVGEHKFGDDACCCVNGEPGDGILAW